jgi:hypothetical protein
MQEAVGVSHLVEVAVIRGFSYYWTYYIKPLLIVMLVVIIFYILFRILKS